MQSIKQQIQFLTIGKGSLYELETQVLLATDLKFSSQNETKEILVEISELQRMIEALITTINSSVRDERV